MTAAAFYVVSSREYFLGAVALINSLRLQGQSEPVYVLDRGLTAIQRELLSPEATLVEGPADAPPHLLKTIAPRRHPADVMVLLDADIIVVRPLDALMAEAAEGRVIAFEDTEDRWEPEWGELLDLGDLRRRRYVTSAFVALGGEIGKEVVDLVDDRVKRVDITRTFYEIDLLDPNTALPDYALKLLDQDVLNAVLAAVASDEQAICLDPRGMGLIPYEGISVVEEARPRCAYQDGSEPYLLHHVLPGKPWLQVTAESPYSQLLRRVLTGSGLSIELPRELLPLHIQRGVAARLARARGRLTTRARMALGPWRARLGDRLVGGRARRRAGE
jgi:hypothetical protein